MNCKHILIHTKYYNVCELGLYGGRPSHGVCRHCISTGANKNSNPSGLGDMVHKIAQPIARTIDGALGTDLQNCGGCKNRRAALNRMFPFKAGTNP